MPVNIPKISKPITKSELLTIIADNAEISKKQAAIALETLSQIIEAHISKKGPGIFVLPGMAKIITVKKPATKARKGINPFTKETTTFAAKPARTVVKIRPLKKLKEAAL